MNRHWENRLYRNMGMMVILAVFIIALLPFIDANDAQLGSSCQTYTCKGVDVKENTLAFKSFLHNIKQHDGVLVLGSSETGAFGKENFHGLLNTNFDCGYKFSVLAGAGRTAHVYFPVMLNNKKAFSGLKVLYFINPTYWRESLNYFHQGYYDRYNSLKKVLDAKSDLEDLDLYDRFASEYVNKILEDSLIAVPSVYLEEIRSYYAENVIFNPRQEMEGDIADCVDAYLPQSIDSTYLLELLNKIDLQKNISFEFAAKNDTSFVKISASTFQWEALKGFNNICSELGIEITYFLGPFNGIYCEKYNPEFTEAHEKIVSELKAFLENEQLNYIDGSDLSYIPGSFIDKQHHSEYAAWIIADRIARYYEKNR